MRRQKDKPQSNSERSSSSRANRFPPIDHSDPFLKTKLQLPVSGANLVLRPRLMEQLTEALQQNLVLVSAPAGSGKTTLLGQWASRCAFPVAWLSLDAADNDPVRFSASLIESIRTQRPNFGSAALALLRSSAMPTVESVVTLLVNEIASTPNDLVLVLDDYHILKNDAIHQGIALLLEHPAPRLHLVIATRTDPPLPLARLRAKNLMSEIKLGDLNFTLAETDSFLNQTMRLGLKSADVTALGNRTEGWIVGLMTAALSIRDHGDIHKFVATFSGDNWRIVDYLIEEVVNRQPESIRDFLWRTSILDRLNGSLSEAVAGLAHGEGQKILEQLERANLFTVPLDSARSWYRYHPLFAECLRTRLRLLHPSEEPILHIAASAWYRSKGIADSAMKHAQSASEYELVADLIQEYAEGMVIHSEVATLLSWLKSLPAAVIRTRPFLSIWYSHALLASGQADAAEVHVLDAIRLLDNPASSIDPTQSERMRNHTLALRAAIAATRRDPPLTIELSQQALARPFGRDDYFLHGRLLHNLGSAYLWNGDVVSAEKYLSEALVESEAPGNAFTSVLAACQLAGVQVAQGRLRDAMKTYQRAIRLAADENDNVQPIAGRAYLGLAQLYYEWNNLDTAKRWATDGVELAKQSGMMDILSLGYRVMSRLAQARGYFDEAEKFLEEAEHLALANRLKSEMARVAMYQARLNLDRGNIRAARHWAESSGLSANDEPSYLRESGHITLARVLITQDKSAEVIKLLERLLRAAESTGQVDSQIKILVFLAQAVEKTSVAEATHLLARAVSLAAKEGYARTFIDAGKPMMQLLARLHDTTRQDYTRQLLGQAASPSTIDLLSPREGEVLQMIAAGCSRPQIATKLVISPNTVRTHTRTIYEKLHAHNRAEALAKAKELGLLAH